MVKLSNLFYYHLSITYCSPTTPFLPKQKWFGLIPFRSPLLWESLLFYFPLGTQMFQFPRFAFNYIECQIFNLTGCPIRKSTGYKLFAPNRCLSQLITSFIASESQGIHHTPLFYLLFSIYFNLYPKYQRTFYVENIGVEPMTSCVQGRRSSQLS